MALSLNVLIWKVGVMTASLGMVPLSGTFCHNGHVGTKVVKLYLHVAGLMEICFSYFNC